MTNTPSSTTSNFGGDWTIQKLEILEDYLNAYTTALKNQDFRLMYIDAFAGTGYVSLRNDDEDAKSFIEGSAARALRIEDKPFDRLVFVENDDNRYGQLATLRQNNLDRDIRLHNTDANEFLRNLQEDWIAWRGVLFLDPFATQVDWSTIERVARFNALDTWILFPLSAITRMLPRSRQPDDISTTWTDNLNRVFGDDSWRNLYEVNPQLNLFGDEQFQRQPGTDGILEIYKRKLEVLFGNRFLSESKRFTNSNNSPIFEFIFCVGNPGRRAVGTAKKIARYIIDASV